MGAYFQRGAYFHAVLINTCNFMVAHSCVGRVILGLEDLFLLISVQCVWFFYNQRYSQQSIDHCQPPAHQRKAPGTNESVPWEFFFC